MRLKIDATKDSDIVDVEIFLHCRVVIRGEFLILISDDKSIRYQIAKSKKTGYYLRIIKNDNT
jgi:hypothetical protein